MRAPPFRKVQMHTETALDPATLTRVLEQVQSSADGSTRRLAKLPILNGELLTGIELSTTPLEVPHKLSRQPRGWFIADLDADARVWRTAWNTKTITLDASAAVTAAIWVF